MQRWGKASLAKTTTDDRMGQPCQTAGKKVLFDLSLDSGRGKRLTNVRGIASGRGNSNSPQHRAIRNECIPAHNS